MESSVGAMFGKYLLLKKLESGGMGEIFLAKVQGPVGFEKLVVIKRILSQHLDNQHYLDMFLGEARLAAKLSHSNIVQLYDMGQVGDAYYHAMEYISGRALRDLIDRARKLGETFEPAIIIDIMSSVCAGLSYAHNLKDINGNPLNIIHRDINPQNIMISYAGDVKLIDFGIAKSEMSLHKTETGTLKGKFVYMSPEQSAAEKLDHRSDIFALGICLYELIAQSNPFAKANVVLSLDAIQRHDPPPPSTISPRYAPFDEIVAKALAKEPAQRFQDATEMRNDLQKLLLSGEVKASRFSLASFMTELFEERIEQEKAWLREVENLKPQETSGPIQVPQSPSNMNAMPTNPNWQAGTVPGVQPQNRQSFPGHPITNLDSGHYAQPQMPMPNTYVGARGSKLPLIIVIASILLVGVAGAGFIIKLAKDKRRLAQIAATKKSERKAQTANKNTKTQAKDTAASSGGENLQAAPKSEKGKSARTSAGKASSSKRRGHSQQRKPYSGETEPKSKPAKRLVIINNTPAVATPSNPRTPAAKPEPKSAARQQHGVILVNSQPTAQVFLAGRYSGQTPQHKIMLSAKKGSFLVGDSQTPFKVTFDYAIRKSKIRYRISSNPWSIVKQNNISLGKSPQSVEVENGPQKFEFIKPGISRNMVIILRFRLFQP